MTSIRWDFVVFWLLGLAVLGAVWLGTGEALVMAAQAEPMATATPVEPCIHIATAEKIKIFRCEDWETGNLFLVNSLGFMLNEPY